MIVEYSLPTPFKIPLYHPLIENWVPMPPCSDPPMVTVADSSPSRLITTSSPFDTFPCFEPSTTIIDASAMVEPVAVHLFSNVIVWNSTEHAWVHM